MITYVCQSLFKTGLKIYVYSSSQLFFDMRDMLRKLQTSRNCNTAYGRVSRVSHVGTPQKNHPFENPIVSPCFFLMVEAPSPMTQNCIPLRRHLPKQLREHPAWPTRKGWPVRCWSRDSDVLPFPINSWGSLGFQTAMVSFDCLDGFKPYHILW